MAPRERRSPERLFMDTANPEIGAPGKAGVVRHGDGNSAVMLISARLRHVSGTAWRAKRYLNMDHLIQVNHPANEEVTA